MKIKQLTLDMVKNMDSDSRYNVAMTDTDKEILEYLSNDEDDGVRHSVTQNSDVPLKILEKLSEDKDESVRMGVATSNNVSKEILEKLSNDKYFGVRLMVCINPDTPKNIFKRLLTDEELNNRDCFGGYNTLEDISYHVYLRLYGAILNRK